MTTLSDKLQTFLFALTDLGQRPRSWSVLEFNAEPDERQGDNLSRQVARALRQALDNVSIRRDSQMRGSSFDIFALEDAQRYLLALPEDLHPAVRGMIERKLLELPCFDRMERGVASLGRGFRPAGYYEAGAVWVLLTSPLSGRGFDRRRLRAIQLGFDFDS